MRKIVWIPVAIMAVVMVLYLFVIPARDYLHQRRSLRTTEAIITSLARENKILAHNAQSLRTPAQIESLARPEFGLVLPGEEAYAILPAVSTKHAKTPSHSRAARTASG